MSILRVAILISMACVAGAAQQILPQPFPDNQERWEGDQGFSRGHGMTHHAFSFDWFDCHVHLAYSHYPNRLTGAEIQEVMDKWFRVTSVYQSGRAILLDPYLETTEWAKNDPRVYAFWWLNWEQANLLPEIRRRADEGLIQGLKLHTADFRSKPQHDYHIMGSQAWHAVYDYCGQAGLPILIHLNQHWGGEGYTNGNPSKEFWATAGYTNQEMLDYFLQEMAGRHPQTKWILAHMNYQGCDAMARIFDRYPNVYADTSIGMFLREFDTLTPEEIQPYRDFCIRYADHLMFGTDAFAYHPLASDYPGHLRNWWLPHQLFIMQLRLPQATLDKITHGTCEQVLGKRLKTPRG